MKVWPIGSIPPRVTIGQVRIGRRRNNEDVPYVVCDIDPSEPPERPYEVCVCVDGHYETTWLMFSDVATKPLMQPWADPSSEP